MADLEHYPYRKVRDVRSAMARRLAEFIRTLEFAAPATATPTKFAAVYEEWATFERRAVWGQGPLPAATVLPDKALPDDDAFVPRPLEETWSGALLDDCGCQQLEGGIGDGTGVGHVLWVVAEKVVPFVVYARAKSRPMRQAMVSVFEDAFLEAGDADRPEEPTWGRIFKMPEYYDRTARFTFEGHELVTSLDSAKENRWIVQFSVRGEAKQCVLRPGVSFEPRVALVVNESGVETIA